MLRDSICLLTKQFMITSLSKGNSERNLDCTTVARQMWEHCYHGFYTVWRRLACLHQPHIMKIVFPAYYLHLELRECWRDSVRVRHFSWALTLGLRWEKWLPCACAAVLRSKGKHALLMTVQRIRTSGWMFSVVYIPGATWTDYQIIHMFSCSPI